jgi:hypothetical protein
MTGIKDTEGFKSADRRLARLVFFTFVLTFVTARVIVYAIMSHKLPDLFLYVGGTHVHHLNFGIFLLCGVGAYLLFARPDGGRLRIAAVLYAIGLALTFDEFGMWLHLGGSYWQRGSYDAIAVVAGTLGFFAFFPSRQELRRWPWRQAATVLAVGAVFFFILAESFQGIEKRLAPHIERLEQIEPK